MQRIILHALVAIGIVASLLANTAAAYDFGCQYVWNGPSVNNDVLECAQDVPNEKPGLIIPSAIPMFFFILLLVIFPIVFLGRCCGACGSNTQRPGADCCCDGSEWDAVEDKDEIAAVYHSKPTSITCVKFTVFLLLLVSVASVVLLPVGASQAVKHWQNALDRVDTDILDWVTAKRDELMASLRDPVDGSLPSPITENSFTMIDDTLKDVRDIKNSISDGTDQAITILSSVTYALAAIPTVGMVLVAIFALCNCRRCCPACFQCIFYPLGLIYALLSTLFLTTGMIFLLAHGEAQLQEKAMPGIFGWYLVPYCESEIQFESIKSTVNTAINDASLRGCQELLSLCDGEPLLLNPLSSIQFYCPTIANQDLSLVCRTPSDLSYVINSTYAKVGSPVCGGANCSIPQCPDQCVVAEARDTSQQALEAVTLGVRVSKALAKAFLFADCDVLLAQFVKPLTEFQDGGYGFIMAGIGFSVGMMCFILSMIVLCKGQKMFVAKPSWMGSGAKPY